VYSIKSNADGSDKYKARYVAKGYSQEMGVDYGETFSPTVNLTSVRVLMSGSVDEGRTQMQYFQKSKGLFQTG